VPTHGLLQFWIVSALDATSAAHNEVPGSCGNFSLVHKGFTASIEVTY